MGEKSACLIGIATITCGPVCPCLTSPPSSSPSSMPHVSMLRLGRGSSGPSSSSSASLLVRAECRGSWVSGRDHDFSGSSPLPLPLLLALHMDLILVQRPSFFWTFLLLLLLAAYIIKTMALPQLSSSTRLRPLVEYGPQGKPNIEC